METFTGHNSDSYTGQGKIWEIAKRHNDESRKHTFDRHGNMLNKEVTNNEGENEIVAKLTHKEMLKRKCIKHETLNVSRRKVSKEEYKPVGLL